MLDSSGFISTAIGVQILSTKEPKKSDKFLTDGLVLDTIRCAYVYFGITEMRFQTTLLLEETNQAPGKILSPIWCTVPLQYVCIWVTTQAQANWVTTNIV